MSPQLFPESDLPLVPSDPGCLSDTGASSPSRGTPRLRVPVRNQIEFQELSLDDMLEPQHPARIVWAAVCQCDLRSWLNDVQAVEGEVGRDATDPRLLLSLWVLATLDAVGSGRELARLSTEHIAYQWLCGKVSVNYHTLNDFRSSNGGHWDSLLTEIVASLTHAGLVSMDRVAQDGMRVRADAGKSSFHRESTLEEHLKAANEQIERLKKQLDDPANTLSAREAAARKFAAEDRARRVADALKNVEVLREQREATQKKSGRKPKEPRGSTTDPDARIMQFANGGFGPGMNVQFSTDTATGIIVGTEVTNSGSDQEQLAPMLDQLEVRYGKYPDEATVDGGYTPKEQIEAASARGCTVYGPLKDEQKQLDKGKDPYAAKKGDSPVIAAWRARMGTELGKQIYKLRCQTAEWVNAQCRNHGLQQMPVRGLIKCRIIALLHAITHNLMVGRKLRAAATAGSTT